MLGADGDRRIQRIPCGEGVIGLRLEQLLQVFLKVCDAVGFAHSHGVIHCDINPRNVMVGTHGQVYLLDWGLAVVRSTVQDLGGTLAVDSEAGRGTAFRITLPLTLAITDAIVAHVGSHSFAVPQAAVRELIEVEAASLRTFERNELLAYRGGTLPIIRLSQLFALGTAPRPRYHAIVVGSGLAAVGLLVDRIGGQREVVVKTIADPLIRVDGVSGATELGDGRVVLILDLSALSRTVRHRPRSAIDGVSA